MPRRFLHRHQPAPGHADWIKAGIGGLLGIGAIAWLSTLADAPLLIAPFGASAVLLFAAPDSPLSQPVNVVGGHLVASATSLIVLQFLPHEWWAAGVAVGVVIALTSALRITHPPAGADPLVIFLGQPGPFFLFTPILVGSLALVAIAVAVHRLPPRRRVYPLPVPETLKDALEDALEGD